MYNRLFKCLTENSVFDDKQFELRNSHSAEHAIIELINKLLPQFERNRYTLGIFIDLPKVFNTINHQILLKKLKLYGVTGKNFSFFENYLCSRKQCIAINN